MTDKDGLRNILVAQAWPYANGSLHLGHMASFVGADVLARYHRLKGDDVLFVSGSDCYGTPTVIESMSQGVSPESIVEKYHEEFCRTFEDASFSFDLYTKTTTDEHRKVVQEVFLLLYEKGLIYTKTDKALYSSSLDQFLPDRFVEGVCPHCSFDGARGDQCDECGKLLDSLSLKNPRVNRKVLKGALASDSEDHSLEIRESEHFYLKLSAFQDDLEKWVAGVSDSWRLNAAQFTKSFLKQGLHDRAITRDTEWGIPIPVEGYEGKRIYVWFEAVLGYLSTTRCCLAKRGISDDWKRWFDSESAIHYYVHGKDNVPFHAIILPALYMGTGISHLPDRIFSSEYLLLEGKQFSTSRSWAVWVPEFLKSFDSELLRYYMIAQGPETSDIDFRWSEFGQMVNGELIGTFGNLVNRICTFVYRNFPDGVSCDGLFDDESNKLLSDTEEAFAVVGEYIEAGRFRQAFREVLKIAEQANRFAHIKEPWKHLDDTQRVQNDLFVLLHTIYCLSLLVQPFLPKTSYAMQNFFDREVIKSDAGTLRDTSKWRYPSIEKEGTISIAHAEPLFKKIEDTDIQKQKEKLRVL